MNRSAADLLRAAAGRTVVDEDGNKETITLLPPLTEEELARLALLLPCPLPPDARELLTFARGFEGGTVESMDLGGLMEPIFEEIFPCGLPIAHDGYGNYWVLDLVSTSTVWGPVFFLCHDAPVVVYQCPDVATFIRDLLVMAEPPHSGPIDEVHEGHMRRIWKENPGALLRDEALASPDDAVRRFAADLTPEHWIVDLRSARTGDGFSWGRFGPNTPQARAGEERIFAYQSRSRSRRLLGWLTGR